MEKRTATSSCRAGIPQLFTSLPALNDAASYLAGTSSIFTRCFPDVRIRPISEDATEQETIPLVSGESRSCSPNWTASSKATVSESVDTKPDAPVVQEAITGAVTAYPTQPSDVLVHSNTTNRKGIFMFQGLVEKVRRTVRGSADDIGWLQKAADMPPVEDGTERFKEIISDIRHGLHGLPKTMVYLLVPGLFSNHGPLYFVNIRTSFMKMGLTCHIAKIHSEASVDKNAKEIKSCIEEIYRGSQKLILILGHSKGGIDSAAAMSLYWDELKDKVAGLVLAQSPYGGTPMAADILREGQIGDYVNIRKLMEILISKVSKGDIQALEDLTYEKRKAFLREHQLPPELPVLSYHTEASISPSVLATLSHVAHAELPVVSALSMQPPKVPVAIPLGAAMAACAQLLQIRYGVKSDGLVTCPDAEVPGSVVVRPQRKLDHAWMVYSSLDDDPSEANASQVIITKCLPLFCNPYVQRVIESLHRKCPVCAASFGANHVKPVYI